MLKIRRSHDHLIFNMGFPIPGKDGLYIEMGPCYPESCLCCPHPIPCAFWPDQHRKGHSDTRHLTGDMTDQRTPGLHCHDFASISNNILWWKFYLFPFCFMPVLFVSLTTRSSTLGVSHGTPEITWAPHSMEWGFTINSNWSVLDRVKDSLVAFILGHLACIVAERLLVCNLNSLRPNGAYIRRWSNHH